MRRVPAFFYFFMFASLTAGSPVRQLFGGDVPLPFAHQREKLLQIRARLERVEKEGGWPRVQRVLLKRGSAGTPVIPLRKRLGLKPGEVFDAEVEAKVRDFQRRHNMTADGVVGPFTVEALNAPPSRWIHKIDQNLSRMETLPGVVGEKNLLINIPEFKLTLFEKGEVKGEMKVIIGRPERPTPHIQSVMTDLVFNPRWYVPNLIALKDKIPDILKNPSVLETEGIRVYQYRRGRLRPVADAKIDWEALSLYDGELENFPFRLVQMEGPKNALGRVKFVFANDQDIYLHDTPLRGLFEKERRAFSSGCIRVAEPFKLVDFLMAGEEDWSPEKMEKILEKGESRQVRVPEGISVHIVYWTAMADENGELILLPDIYGLDG